MINLVKLINPCTFGYLSSALSAEKIASVCLCADSASGTKGNRSSTGVKHIP